jgi:hypothetical protein
MNMTMTTKERFDRTKLLLAGCGGGENPSDSLERIIWDGLMDKLSEAEALLLATVLSRFEAKCWRDAKISEQFDKQEAKRCSVGLKATEARALLKEHGVHNGPVVWRSGNEFEGLVWHDCSKHEWSCLPISAATTPSSVLSWAAAQVMVERDRLAKRDPKVWLMEWEEAWDGPYDENSQAKTVAWYDNLAKSLDAAAKESEAA